MNPEEIDFLIAGWLDGRLTPDQHARLEQALLADPAARQRLRSQGNLDVALREWASAIGISAAWNGRETADGEPLLPDVMASCRFVRIRGLRTGSLPGDRPDCGEFGYVEDGLVGAARDGRASWGVSIVRKRAAG